MTNQRWCRGLFALFLAVACRAPDRDAAAPQPTRTAQPSSQPAATERRRTPRPAVAAITNLPRRASELEEHGQPLASLRLISKEIDERLNANTWTDSRLIAESVSATLAWERLANATNAWDETIAALEACKPFARETPPELAGELDLLLALGLRTVGRIDEARALTASRGALTDWLMIGPFANERGGGFDTKYAPEEGIDLTKAVRGKERDVAWRANPAPEHPLGAIRIDDLVRPNDQAIVYFATAIRVDAAREVVMHLGSSGSIKVFNGELEVLSRKVERPFHPDQDRVVLALQPGWNRVLVKTGIEEKQPWIFSARLCELDGSPARGCASDAKQVAHANATATAATSKPAANARDVLEALDQDAEAARMLAAYHLFVHPDDKAAKTARTWAEKARALEPDDARGLYLVALTNAPEQGTKLEETQINAHLFPLKDVLAHDAKHVAGLLDLASFAMDESPTPERADELTSRALAAAPTNWRAMMARAAYLDSRNRDAEARVLREKARDTEEGRLQTAGVLARAHALTARGELDASLNELKRGFDHGQGDDALVAALVTALFDRGDVAGAVEVTRQQSERAPFDTDRLLATAQLLEYSNEIAGARELVEHARRICPEDTRVHLALARLAQRDGDLETADKELAEVLRLEPGYDKARRQRQILASTAEDRFEQPYRWDALERIDPKPIQSADNDPVSIVDRTSVWRVNADGTEHQYEHILLRAQNLGGVKSLDNYSIGYPGDASLQVYNVRVIRPNKSFERAPAPRRGDFDYGDNRWRPFDLPPIEVGDFVELEYRVDESRSDVFGQYFGLRHEFYPDYPDPLAPVARSELVVIAPADVPLYTTERKPEMLEKSKTTDAQGNVVYRWVASGLKRPPMQSAMPPRTEYAPAVDVSTFASWQAFGSWWWHFVEKEFVTTPAMKQKVAELTKGLTTEHDKVRAIAKFVGQEIRYNAWPFGTHGYEPYSAATIFERRFGDCKDKSILLRQLLAEIGVEAYPVILKAQAWRPKEFLDVAMIGAFNHCIAYLPATNERPGYYLDATADRNPIEYLRADDQGATVVHVHDGTGTIEKIPYSAPEQNALTREYDVALDADGGGEVKLVDTSNGEYGVELRYAFGGEKGDLNKRLSQALAEEFGKVDVVAATTSVLEDIGAPARVETTIRSQGLWSRDAAGANLRLGFDAIPILSIANEAPAEREFDLVLDRPFAMHTRVLYHLPKGAKLAKLPTDASVVAPGLLEYHMTASETADGIEVRRDFKLLERRIGKDRYADFRGALRDVELAESRTVLVEPPPSEPRKGEK